MSETCDSVIVCTNALHCLYLITRCVLYVKTGLSTVTQQLKNERKKEGKSKIKKEERHKERHTERQTERHKERHKERHTEKQKKTHRKTQRETHRKIPGHPLVCGACVSILPLARCPLTPLALGGGGERSHL